MTTISDDVAEILARHNGHLGYLSLCGLKTISDEAAKALANHQGDLSLDGLTRI